MQLKRLVAYSVYLGIGGLFAWGISPLLGRRIAQARGAPPAVLTSDNNLHEYMTGFLERLEDGSANLASVLDTTAVLLDCVKPEMHAQGEQGEIELPLVSEAERIGVLKDLGEQPDGHREWALEVMVPALPRYGELAQYSELSIKYRGTAGKIEKVVALVQSPLHHRPRTVEVIGTSDYLIGGCLAVDETSASWSRLALSVELEPDGTPVWTSKVAATEPRDESLGAADSRPVAAVLFSL